MPVYTDLNLNLSVQSSKTPVIQGVTPLDALAIAKRIQLASGTAAGQADKLWYSERTINASSNDDLDITGSLVDNFGVTFTIARVKLLLVIAGPSNPATTRNANNVVLGAAASNQWATLLNAAGTVTLRPDAGFLAWAGPADATGWTVTAGTGDIFRVANGGAGTQVIYQIAVVAASV